MIKDKNDLNQKIICTDFGDIEFFKYIELRTK